MDYKRLAFWFIGLWLVTLGVSTWTNVRNIALARALQKAEAEVQVYRDAVGTLNLLLTESRLTSLPICERPNEFPQSVEWNVWRSSDGPEPDWTRVTSWDEQERRTPVFGRDAQLIGTERER